MSGDNLNTSGSSGLVDTKSTTTVQTETVINTEMNGECLSKEITEFVPKETVDTTDSQNPKPEEQNASSENTEVLTPKRKIEEIESNSEKNEKTKSTSPLAKKQKDEAPIAPTEKNDKGTEKTVNVTPTRFGFGSTLSDPKYAWLKDVGKTTESKSTEGAFRTEKPSGLFGSNPVSNAPSLSEITPSENSGFGDLLQSAPESATPSIKASPAMSLKDTSNGEENEATCFETKGKLHVMGPEKKWVERGMGLLKINYKQDNVSERRLIMRLEAVHKVILNVKIPPKLKPTADGKFVRFSAFENESSPSHFLFRTSLPSTASQMVEEMAKASE